MHSQKTIKTRRTIAHAPERPVPDQLAEHAELPIRQVPQLRIAFDGPLSPQHAELPLQAVRTPRHRGPCEGHQRQDIQLRRGVGHDVEKIDGFQMGNQDGQHLVLCEIPAGDAVHVHRQEPVPEYL